MRLAIVFLLFVSSLALGQTSSLQGKFFDAKSKSPLAGVHVRLVNQADTSETYNATTGADGVFKLDVPPHSYLLSATYVGFAKFTKAFSLDKPSVDLGDLVL